MYHIGTYLKARPMIIISSRGFRDNQKKYLDLVDKKEQVVIQRGKNKAYALRALSEKDRYFSDPEILAHIKEGIEQVKRGETITVKKEDLAKFLGL